MKRRESDVPQTPVHNDDEREKSIRRQLSSTRGSIASIVRRAHESPLTARRPESRSGNIGQSPHLNTNQNGENSVSQLDYEEWMRMVRQKRVKSTNAFTIQLIDAFHSMVQGHLLSSDAANVTFQEATHTLGGCLTVYKNRITRVKDDTSKLLVGVTENKQTEIDDDDEGGSNSDGEDSEAKRQRKSRKRKQHNTFLLPAKALQIDTNELKTAIGPLLRKMSADFDKRGAGALLQYSLKSDTTGRLLLDAGTQEDTPEPKEIIRNRSTPVNALPGIIEEDENESENESEEPQEVAKELAGDDMEVEVSNGGSENSEAQVMSMSEMILAHFNLNYFAKFDFKSRETLPASESISRAVSNPKEGTDALVREMEAWASANPEDEHTYDNVDLNLENEGLEGNDIDNADFFGDEDNRFAIDDPMNDSEGELDNNMANLSISSIVSSRLPSNGDWRDVNYLKKLDEQSTNWAGPSFWKIHRLQKNEVNAEALNERKIRQKTAAAAPPVLIDFHSDEVVDIEELFRSSGRSIKMPTSQLRQNRHLLPVDMHVNTSDLTSLYLMPNSGVAPAFKRGPWRAFTGENGAFEPDIELGEPMGDYPGDDFGNGTIGGLDGNEPVDNDYYAQAWDEHPPPSADQYTQFRFGRDSTQLGFARVAKRVDVRRLKENVWRGITDPDPHQTAAEPSSPHRSESKSLKNIIVNTQPLYNEAQRHDLSPAMYFISLLHLSNEKGLTLNNTDDYNDINIIYNP